MFGKGRFPGLFSNNNKGMATMFLARLIRLFRMWHSYDRSVRELSRLNDRELADIGISRSEIAAVAWTSARK